MATNQTGIERIGVETVVQSLNTFQRDMNSYIKQLDTAGKTTTTFAKTTEQTSKSGGSFLDFFKKGTGEVSGFSSAITSLINPTTIAIGAITALGTAIFNLGIRGGEVIGVQTAFENLVAPILKDGQKATDYLNELRTAAGDTISAFDLMKATNLALAGTTGAFRDEFANALPQLLEVARVQAAATGQSVTFLYDSLVAGIKRSSPLRIDNTGLVISEAAANQKYADSIGVTVEMLTQEQKNLALVIATSEAAALAVDNAGGIQETAAQKWARSQALIRNSLDALSVAFEPLVANVLDGVNNLLSGLESGIQTIAPIITEVLSRVASGVSSVIQFFSPAITVIMDGIKNFVNFLGLATVQAIKGAAAISAAIGNGLLAGANHFIFPAVIQIATFIADFLSGFSPPKKGPLSTIDKGAGNVMEAWMQGFVGGFSITPIEQVTSEVNTALGNIGKMSAKQVEDRLARLDLALRPFQERVKLLEDSFNALKEFTDAGLSAIDAEVNRLLPALAAGDQQAAERIRQLNEQREQIEGITFAREQQLNQAKIDLALARGRQQQERTLLEIQQGRVGKYKEEAKAISKVATETEKVGKEKKPKGAGATPVTPSAIATGATQPSDTPLVNLTGEPNIQESPFAAFDEFTTALGEDFLSGLNAGGELDTFNANMGELDAQFARIGASDPVQGILGAFSNFGTEMQTIVQDAVGWFTDPEKDGLAGFINRINTEGATAVFGDVVGSITTWLQDTFGAPFKTVADLVLSVFRDPSDPNSLASYFTNFSDNISEQWGDVSTSIGTWITDNLITPFIEKIEILTGGTDVEGSIASYMAQLPTRITEAVGDTGLLITNIFAGIQSWVMGTTEDGGLPGLINRLLTPFRSIPIGIWNALRNIGTIAWNVLVVPFISAVNEIIQRINEFFGAVNNSGLVAFARETLNLQIPNISFNEISTAPPAWLQPPPMPVSAAGSGGGSGSTAGFAKGGLASAGEAWVGERGREKIMSAEPFAVFSNQFVRAIDQFSNAIMGGGFSQGLSPALSGIGTQNIDNSININANTQAGFNNAELANRISMARVFGR